MEKIQAYQAALKTLKLNHVMVEGRDDGVYIRLAGNRDNGCLFSNQWVKIYDIQPPSKSLSFAQNELHILSRSASDPENRPVIEPFIPEILSLVDKFGKSGQSGGSAPYTATAISHAIKKLCLQEPICPITGIDEEWVDVAEYNDGDPWYQNARCSAIFKAGKDGRPYYLDAIVWKDQNGNTFTGKALLKDGTVYRGFLSRQGIKSFPFTPKTFYIDVTRRELGGDEYEFFINSEKQLKRVFRYYDEYTD